MQKKENILFGAGEYGKKVLRQVGAEKFKYIIDNDAQKQGSFLEGIEIISFNKYLEIADGYQVWIGGNGINRHEMERQLKDNKIRDGWSVAQLVECLPSIHEAPGSISSTMW